MYSRNGTSALIEGGYSHDAVDDDETLSIEAKERRFSRTIAIGRAAVADMLGIRMHDYKTPDEIIAERQQALLDEENGIERPEELTRAQKIGRAATAPLRWDQKMIKAVGASVKAVDRGLTRAAWRVAGWMPGMKSIEERQAAYDRRQVKYAPKDDDNFFMRRWKHFLRHREKYTFYSVATGLGALAVSRYAGAATDWYDHHVHAGHSGNAATVAAGNHPEIKAGSSKLSMVVAGGRGEGGMDGQPGAPVDQMMAYGDQNDVNVQAVQYPAEIAPLDPMSMKQSTNIGVADMMGKAQADMANGQPVELIGFSEGTSVALDTAKQIAAQNGGVLPSNVHLTLIGSPYTPGSGIAASPFAKGMIGGVVDAMGIPLHEGPLPPGTNVVYYDTDFWANSGNQVPTSMMRQLVEIGMGGHAVPDPNDPHYSFTDGQGVIHTVYSHRNDPILQQMIDSGGLQIADTADANKAINALFPLDGSKPDVAGAKAALIATLENQGDPGSQFAAQFLQNLPPQYTQLGQDGMDGINGMAEGAAKIQSGDVLGGWSDIMGGLNSMTRLIPDATGALGMNGGSGISTNDAIQMLTTNVSGALKQQTGMDFTQQIHNYLANGQAPLVNGQPVPIPGAGASPAIHNALPIPNANGNTLPLNQPILPTNPGGAIPNSVNNLPLPIPTGVIPHVDANPPIMPYVDSAPPVIHNTPPIVHTPVPVIHNTPPVVHTPAPVRTIPTPVINAPPVHIPTPTFNVPRSVSIPRMPVPAIPPGIIPRLGH